MHDHPCNYCTVFTFNSNIFSGHLARVQEARVIFQFLKNGLENNQRKSLKYFFFFLIRKVSRVQEGLSLLLTDWQGTNDKQMKLNTACATFTDCPA